MSIEGNRNGSSKQEPPSTESASTREPHLISDAFCVLS